MTDEAPTPLPDLPRDETGQSSIKLTRNASGNIQFEVKVYALANDEIAVGDAERIATSTLERLAQKYPHVSGAKR